MKRLALGTAQFGSNYGITNQQGKMARREAKSIFSLARTHGIDTVDTAASYGDSETCLGECDIDGVKIITKLPPLPKDISFRGVEGWVRKMLNASFQRLRVRSIYGLLIHRSENVFGRYGKELINSLGRLEADGMVCKTGVSVYSPDTLDSISKVYEFNLVQAPFNVFDQRLETSGWLSRLKNHGVEVHSRSVFLQGLLLMSGEKLPERFKYWTPVFDKWNRKLMNFGFSPLLASLKFVFSHKTIDRIVVGFETEKQLSQILKLKDRLRNDEGLDFSDLACKDERLINPSNWSHL